MTKDRFNQITSYMRHLPLEQALRWCESDACACMGCANNSGGLSKRGVTKAEWREWWSNQVDHIVYLDGET